MEESVGGKTLINRLRKKLIKMFDRKKEETKGITEIHSDISFDTAFENAMEVKIDNADEIVNNDIVVDEEVTSEEIKEEKKEISNEQKKILYEKTLSTLLTKIYADCITLEEIDEANISEWNKDILKIAYYEKYNRKLGQKYIKEVKIKNTEKPKRIKHLNKLNSYMQSTKLIFDLSKYEKMLYSGVNLDLYQKLLEEKNNVTKEDSVDEKETRETKEEIKILKKEKEEKKYVIVTGKTVDKRSSTANNVNNIAKDKEVLVKDIFSEEVDSIKKYLYVKMNIIYRQRDAIKAWDILDNISTKPITDKENLTKFIALLKRLEPSEQLKISVDDKKVKKLLK